MSRGMQPSSRRNHGEREKILKKRTAMPAGGFGYLAWGIVLLGLAQLCWLQGQPESEWWRSFPVTMKSTEGPANLGPEQVDQIAVLAGNGNVVLSPVGYANTNTDYENLLEYIYYRGSYALYPRRLYVAPAGQIIKDGRDIVRAGFNPSPQWLQAHNVGSVVTVGIDGILRLHVLQLDPAGIPIHKTGNE